LPVAEDPSGDARSWAGALALADRRDAAAGERERPRRANRHVTIRYYGFLL
jgi:hypothetical protein